MPLPRFETIALPHGPARLQWRRNARARRISLRIDARDGDIVVTLPPRAAHAAGRALVLDHAGWLAERLARLPAPRRLQDGAEILVGGVPHRITHRPGARGVAWLDGATLHVTGTPEFLARRVLDFLRAEARRRVAARAAEKAAQAGLRLRRVVVKDTRSRWGSCTADGTVMICWRLVMAPDPVQDYVVAHEVAHLRHMNHGAQFWALVETLTPHRVASVRWLVEHGAGLMRVG